MAICDVCGNDYAESFQVTTTAGERFTFDSIECAAHKIAPRCRHCQCSVLGHGIQSREGIYCCANCARQGGASSAVDNTLATSP
jgi:hypothetical protein